MKLLFKFVLVVLLCLPCLASAGQNYPEPCNYKDSAGVSKASPLCGGLIEYWGFEEASDSPRFGAFGTPLLEVSGKNTARIAEILATLEGSWSLDLASANQGWLWQLGGLPAGSSTISVWFKTNSLGAVGTKYTIVSANTVNVPGPELYFEVTTVGTSGKVCYTNYEAETGTQIGPLCSSAGSVTGQSLHMVTVGESPFFVGKARLFLSLDGAAPSFTSTGYYTRSGITIMEVGAHRSKYLAGPFSQYFDGQLDQLILWSRPLTAAEITLLYNGGAGRAYPFATE